MLSRTDLLYFGDPQQKNAVDIPPNREDICTPVDMNELPEILRLMTFVVRSYANRALRNRHSHP